MLLLSLFLLGPSEKVRGFKGRADQVPSRTWKSSCLAGTKWRGALFPWGRRNWCTRIERQDGGAQKGAENTHLNNIFLLITFVNINTWTCLETQHTKAYPQEGAVQSCHINFIQYREVRLSSIAHTCKVMLTLSHKDINVSVPVHRAQLWKSVISSPF